MKKYANATLTIFSFLALGADVVLVGPQLHGLEGIIIHTRDEANREAVGAALESERGLQHQNRLAERVTRHKNYNQARNGN